MKLIRITTISASLKYLLTGQCAFMREQGFEVIMMSADGLEVPELVGTEGCPHEVVPLTRKITPLADLKALWVLYHKLRKHRPDIVHSHTPKAGLIGMLAAWLARVPVRLHTVAGLPLETATGFKRRLLLFIEKLTYACATEVWPNSQSLYRFIEVNSLAKKDKLHVIGKGSSNGIDVMEYSRDTLEKSILETVKSLIQYDSMLTYLLFVGRVVKDKGVEELVDAFVSLAEARPTLRLVLVGPYESSLDPLASRTMQLITSRPDIISTGFSPDVKYFMALADLFVFPSHREGFPNVPMQAGLMGLPVIASAITGNVDIVKDGVTGLLHQQGDVVELSLAIESLIVDRDYAQGMADKLLVFLRNNFDRKDVHQLILNRYLQFLP